VQASERISYMNNSIFTYGRQLLIFGVAVAATHLTGRLLAGEAPSQKVRIAELEINPAYIAEYKSALKEEIEASIRLEPGVLTLNAMAEKENPTRIRILEVYASEASYLAHIETPHFLKYKTSTLPMVRSLKLIEMVPVLLGSK